MLHPDRYKHLVAFLAIAVVLGSVGLLVAEAAKIVALLLP